MNPRFTKKPTSKRKSNVAVLPNEAKEKKVLSRISLGSILPFPKPCKYCGVHVFWLQSYRKMVPVTVDELIYELNDLNEPSWRQKGLKLHQCGEYWEAKAKMESE